MMGILFTPAEIFEIAIQIERNGARFYRDAAGKKHDAATCALLIELAEMEEQHEATFVQLKKKLVGTDTQPEWYDTDQESFRYLQSFASGQVFDITKERHLPPDAGVQTVLEFALERERESILFYLGIKEWAPPALLGNRVEKIILEEMKHLAQLNKRRVEITAARA